MPVHRLVVLVFAAVALLGHPALAANVATSDTCGECHRDIYRMWRSSVHAEAMEDPLFVSSLREIQAKGDRELAATCLGCHAPIAALTGDTELKQKTSWEGVTCDFCHSLTAVETGESGPRHRIDLGGPKRGPVKDAADVGHEVAYSELHSQSKVCAPCHEYRNALGEAVMNTYTEWLASEASRRGETCQTCHMALTKARVVDPRIHREARAEVNLHKMPGGRSLEQLYKAIGVSIKPERRDDLLEVAVELRNKGAGLAVPTGMPGRRIIMRLTVETSGGQRFEENRTYGRYFEDAQGNRVTHVADYFAPGAREGSDTRLKPDETRVENFRFPIPQQQTVYLNVKLHYEHEPLGDEEGRTWLTFLSEKRLIPGR